MTGIVIDFWNHTCISKS